MEATLRDIVAAAFPVPSNGPNTVPDVTVERYPAAQYHSFLQTRQTAVRPVDTLPMCCATSPFPLPYIERKVECTFS